MNKLLSPVFQKTLEPELIQETPDTNLPMDIFKIDVKQFLDQFKDIPLPLKPISENAVQARMTQRTTAHKVQTTDTLAKRSTQVSSKFGFKRK